MDIFRTTGIKSIGAYHGKHLVNLGLGDPKVSQIDPSVGVEGIVQLLCHGAFLGLCTAEEGLEGYDREVGGNHFASLAGGLPVNFDDEDVC